MIRTTSASLEPIEVVLANILSDGGWVPSRARLFRESESDTIVARLEVADMVLPLRRFTVRTDGSVFRLTKGVSIAVSVADVAKLVEDEREVRRWSFCDQ